MPKQVKPKDLIKIIEKIGFQEVRICGSHHRFVHSDGRRTTIPLHSKESIGVGLLNKVVKKDLKITKEEFEELLNQLILI